MSDPDRELRLPNWLSLNRNFVLLWLAYGVAAVGDHLSEMALLKSRGGLERPDVTHLQALISFGFFLPFVIFGPLAGWWSDRFSRKWTMVAADLLRAGVVFNLGLLVPWLGRRLESYGLGDYSIVLPLGLVGLLAAFFSPARQALLPTLIRDDQLVRANALINALGTIGTIASAIIGGYLVNRFAPSLNFHLNAGTFCLSAVFVGSILMSRTRAVAHPPLGGVWKPLGDGFRYVREHRRVLQLIALGTVFWGAAGVVIAVVPAVSRSYFGDDYAAAGTFRGLIGIGLAFGAGVMSLIGSAIPLQLAILVALLSSGFWVVVLALASALHLGTIVTGLALFMIGGAGAALLVTIISSLQRFVPDSRRGRVFGVSDMATMAAMVAASGLIGLPHIPNLDRYVWLLLLGAGAMILVTLWLTWRDYRRGGEYAADTWIAWTTIRFFMKLWCRMKMVGPCTVPRHGPAIIAANHTSGIDPIAIIGSSPHRLPSFVVAREYYEPPLAKWFMGLAKSIPVDRQNPGKSFLVQTLGWLRRGGVLAIFPEGTFTAPGEGAPEPKNGVAALALRTDAVVIPCHVSGTRYNSNPFMAAFSRHNVRIRYGKPVALDDLRANPKAPGALEQATQRIMQAIFALAPAGSPPEKTSKAVYA